MSQNKGSELDAIRASIDALDRSIVQALAERKRHVQELTRLKTGSALALRDSAREDEVLSRLSALAQQQGLSAYFVRALYREIFDFSLRVQQQHVIDQRNSGERAKRRAIVSF